MPAFIVLIVRALLVHVYGDGKAKGRRDITGVSKSSTAKECQVQYQAGERL